ncbi:DUF1996 domain-containing protein [Symbioplanes lichenis]|uniref:DUF1996 domain-containing protein n=1 Tax=Symbioplanes lichenis TaxID=1629072 RepID=UPI0027393B1C|nr:DUF1996 domain-containing protein [Actinoplanes lichenis]
MRTPAPAHVAPPDPGKKRRRITRISLASAIAVALGGSGVYIAGASADEVTVPGRVQAESYAANSGAQTEGTGDKDGGKNVGWLTSGDWMRYDNVSVTGAAWTARVASNNSEGGSIEIRQGTQTGTLLATFPVASTKGWQTWTTVNAKAASVPSGKQTLFAVLKSKSRSDFVNINWFTFGPAGAASSGPSASPSTTKATPAPSASSSSAPGGWVPVDQAAWQKELDYFNSVALKPVPSNAVRVAEFQTNCEVSGYADDDPIVFPKMAGASHNHTFFGPKVDANTTNEQLLSGKSTTCDAPGDFSAYWAPTLTQNGKVVPMESFRVYYGSRLPDPSDMKPFPPGLRIVQGDAKLQEPTPAGKNGQFWCTGGEIGRSADGNWPKCGGGHLIYQLTFKDCWDGKHIDSPDHKSHMGNAVNGKCQGDFPVAVPNLSFMLNYDTLGGDGLKLSSGMASSIHGDFMNAWDPEKLSDLVKICLTQKAKCGTTPTF